MTELDAIKELRVEAAKGVEYLFAEDLVSEVCTVSSILAAYNVLQAERDTMRAVCEAAKQWLEMRHGPRDVLYGNAQRALTDAVSALVALETQPSTGAAHE